jgi:tripartite-type tricarboxylate transporter receptor subunit TctC
VRVLFALVCLALAAGAAAQERTGPTFPSRSVTLILPIAPGGAPDIEARQLAQFLETRWKRPLVLENRPGAGGLIGVEAAVKATPDGYTLLFMFAGLAAYKALVKDLRIDPQKDLAPISLVVDFPSSFATNAHVPGRTLEHFLVYAKANPGKLNYASIGRTTQYMLVEQFKRLTGAQITEVSYPGTAQTLLALQRGDVHLIQQTMNAAAKPHIESGSIRPLFMVGSQRSKLYPDVPTAAEKGLNIPSNGWQAVFAPAGTPKAIVDQVAADIAAYVNNPEQQKRAQAQGIELVANTPEQMRKMLDAQIRFWSEIGAQIGLKPS